MQKYNNKDICGFVSRQLDLTDICEKHNLSEWYGFKNNLKSARFKVVQTPDSKGNYNFRANGLCDDSCNDELYAIIVCEKIVVIKIDCGCFKTAALMFVVKCNKDTNMPELSECANALNVPCIALELDWNEEILLKINNVNVVFDRISQRSDNVNKQAIEDLLKDEKPHCFYCGITQDQIKKLDTLATSDKTSHGLTKRTYRKTLEVDQKDPEGGYVVGNIVLACSWCNNAKTDTFTCDEFKEIAKGINSVWNQRLGGKGFDDIIKFPKSKPCYQTK